MLRRFHEDAKYGDVGEFVPADMERTISAQMESGVVLVAEDGMLVGMIAALFNPMASNQAVLICSETSWWVDRFYRHQGVGAALLQALKDAALERQCKVLCVASHPDLGGSERIYKEHGYRVSAVSYMISLVPTVENQTCLG